MDKIVKENLHIPGCYRSIDSFTNIDKPITFFCIMTQSANFFSKNPLKYLFFRDTLYIFKNHSHLVFYLKLDLNTVNDLRSGIFWGNQLILYTFVISQKLIYRSPKTLSLEQVHQAIAVLTEKEKITQFKRAKRSYTKRRVRFEGELDRRENIEQ